ncbi:hypothetical protein D1007_54778 [Hordeum vulgare]|nr:hypothetical protein D1007_54778 [Hordeum vulgare]
MSLNDTNPRLEVPKKLLEKTSAWSSAKLSDPRARLAPLQLHSRPLWDYQLGDDKLTLRSQELLTEELNRVVATLLDGDLGDLPKALGPLYRLDN